MRVSILFLFFFTGMSTTLWSQDWNEESILLVGDTAPRVHAYDYLGRYVDTDQIAREGNKTLLVFYRGSWCPVCERHLDDLQSNLHHFKKQGAVLVLVSPEKPNSTQELKLDSQIYVLNDSSYTIMKSFGLEYHLDKTTVPRYFPFVVQRTRKSNENKDDILPIPASYIIDESGLIQYIFYDTDYRNRPTAEVLLDELGSKAKREKLH